MLEERRDIKLKKREFEFEFETEKNGHINFVFTEPNMGQIEIISGAKDKDKETIKKHMRLLRLTFEEMVVIPSVEEFNKIYISMFPDELLEFGRALSKALEDRKKK